jgi:flagellar biosynthesis protein FlhB
MRIGKIFGMQELGDLAMGILMVAMTVAIALVSLDKFKTTLEAGLAVNATSVAVNKTADLITEVGNLTSWVGIIIIVAVASIIFYYLKALRTTSGNR